ncbi:MAG: hypothetical protein GW917_02465 [Bdellovibrionales bacterium]|nr:hypothetical protein [Bdellovibrionales bacterium]
MTSDTNKEFYLLLSRQLKEDFPKCHQALEKKELEVQWTKLVSPYTVELPMSLSDRLTGSISKLYQVTRTPRPEEPSPKIKNHSVLMSYDFHTSPTGEAKLIEINTNASGYLISLFSEAIDQKKSYFDLPQTLELKKSFEKEFSFLSKDSTPQIAIVDDDIKNQKMKFEFFLYRELFERWGWSCEICEASDLLLKNGHIQTPSGHKVNFIYNRSTDFTFKEDQHKVLKSAWMEGLAVVSPQPIEYIRLADKNRLMEWRTNTQLPEDITEVLLKTYDLKDFEGAEQLWAEKKKYFFKPKNSFGGKSAYRGQSLSHKVFDRIVSEDPLIQEHFPPQKQGDWKFDLRCYAYEDRIQHIAARLYKGQLTNFSSEFGGFGLVRLKS